MSNLSIDVRNLSKRYGSIQAISGLSFQVQAGEIVGFLGPNGAGKSTTMRILSGLSRGTSGSASICGVSVVLYPEQVKEQIGYMPENNPLMEDMRVIEYLRFRARLKGVRLSDLNVEVERVMERCQLHSKVNRTMISTLSKGYRQRVGLADALLNSPKILFLDEPTIGLDPHQVRSFRQLLQGLRSYMTVFLSSHILSEIEAVCDRIIIINHGHIVANGSLQSLRTQFFKTERYEVTIHAPKDSFLQKVSKLSFHVIRDESPNYTLEGEIGSDFSEQLFKLAQRESWTIAALTPIIPSLESIFIAATRRS